MTKYIFITGGVLSGVGKGVTSASIAMLLQSMGYNVTAIKIDPYINVDAGTMNPYAHGEVFVTDDGGETDLDIGHYERFLGKNLSKKNNITTGQVYLSVITKERKGVYLGSTVQIIPHVTNEIKNIIMEVAKEQAADITIVEIGGTVGDIEGLPFLEAIRQMRLENGYRNTFFIHVALVPTLRTTGEQKTKPVQHSVQELRRIGIQPDMIVARCEKPLSDEARRKIALYSNVPEEYVISNHDVETIYEVPLILYMQRVPLLIAQRLELVYREPEISLWLNFVEKLKKADVKLRIAMIGKYTKLQDSYISIIEAIKHSSAYLGIKPIFHWIESSELENHDNYDVEKIIGKVDGAIILPGFGKRGSIGKIKAIKYLRENNIPTLGICFGFQLMIVEFARNVLNLRDADSSELNPTTPHPVIDLLPMQRNIDFIGGTMRLGSKTIKLIKGTKVFEAYGRDTIVERHRHRYGVNNKYIELFEKNGFIVSGVSSDEEIVEFMELKSHNFFIGTQAHPEFRSKPLEPSPIYTYFLRTALLIKNTNLR
ncbi:MAG: CTP synthase [Ignisphaera sp.]|uniref:CTP synthase n=1 Tax=Ignisphaera aggregans TaxID=334771 RepID=A0A7C4H7F2_9CREN